MASLAFWVLLAVTTTITLAGFQAESMLITPDYFGKRQVYLVYLDGSKDVKSPLQLLQSVLVTSKPTRSLIYQYKNFNAFAARLSTSEANKLAKTPGVLSVTPSRMYHIDDPPFDKGVTSYDGVNQPSTSKNGCPNPMKRSSRN